MFNLIFILDGRYYSAPSYYATEAPVYTTTTYATPTYTTTTYAAPTYYSAPSYYTTEAPK